MDTQTSEQPLPDPGEPAALLNAPLATLTRSRAQPTGPGLYRVLMGRLRVHPQASLVPAMAESEYRSFREDVERRGILTPLEITGAGVVLNGRHRLRAAVELSLGEVPVRIIDPPDQVEHILLCALAQRHLSASQRAVLVIELEEVQQAATQARLRQRANLRRGTRAPEVATLPPRGKKTRESAARTAGIGERTVQDALTVRKEDPALFERLRTGELSAHLAARRVRRRRRDAELPLAAALPGGPFELLYADPPWRLGNPDGPFAPENHYPTLALEEIEALAPPAAEDAVLLLWAVNSLLPEALEVMCAWGFEYRTNLAWVKPSIALGQWARNRHELLLLGGRGWSPPPDPEDRPDSVIEAPRGAHSQKPACVYELLERAYPQARKLELFARGTPRPGWVFWGNEVSER